MQNKPVRLLIAEDEEDLRESSVKHIRANAKWINEIVTAESGRQAIDMIFMYRPQIMLLDIQATLNDGLEVMKEALSARICPQTVVLSGRDQFGYAQQALRYGAVDYLLKPCRTAEIFYKLDNLARVAHARENGIGEPGAEQSRLNSIVVKALDYMEEHYPENLTLPLVAEKIGISPNYLSALFGKTVNAGFKDKLNNIRIERACDYFAAGGMRTYEVAYKVGFKDEKYFSCVFKKIKGESPSEYRKQKCI